MELIKKFKCDKCLKVAENVKTFECMDERCDGTYELYRFVLVVPNAVDFNSLFPDLTEIPRREVC